VLFAGIDVIGDYLTEVNITSPTCIRELDAQFGLDIAGDLIRRIGERLDSPSAHPSVRVIISTKNAPGTQ
jgi:glutathione synthase